MAYPGLRRPAAGVEVFGCEWFFGASVEGLFHGVNCNESKQHPQHRYRTSVPWLHPTQEVEVVSLGFLDSRLVDCR